MLLIFFFFFLFVRLKEGGRREKEKFDCKFLIFFLTYSASGDALKFAVAEGGVVAALLQARLEVGGFAFAAAGLAAGGHGGGEGQGEEGEDDGELHLGRLGGFGSLL
jgi:hypothetical protein